MRNASFDQKMPSLWHRAPDVLVAMIVREKKNRGKGRSMLAESATRLVHAACLLKVRYAAICRSMPPKAHRVLYPSGDACQGASYMASIGVLVESASCVASILFRRFLQGKCTFRLDSMDAFRILGRSLRQQACDQGLHVSKKKRGRRCASEIHTISYSRAFRVSKTYEIVWMNIVQGSDARNRIKASLREDAREGFFTRGLVRGVLNGG